MIRLNSEPGRHRQWQPYAVALCLCWLIVSAVEAAEITQAFFMPISDEPHSSQHLGLETIDKNSTHWQARSLPDYWRVSRPSKIVQKGEPEIGHKGGQGWYRLDFELSNDSIAIANNWAIYVPKHSRVMSVYLNDKKIGDTGRFSEPLSDNYVMPYFFPIHASLLKPGNNQIYIRLAGYSFDEISLSKIYVDTEENLLPSYNLRYGFSVGVAQIGFYSMMLLAILVFLFWLFRRNDRQYLWFSLTSLSGAVFSSNRIITDFPLPLSADQQAIFFNTAVSLFTLFSVMFLHRFSGLRLYNRERLYIFLICSHVLIALVLSNGYVRVTTNLMHIVDAGYGMYILYVIYSYRDHNVVLDRYLVLGLCCLAYALSFNDLLLRLVDRPYSNWLTLQWAPLLMYIAFVSLVLSRLFRTLKGFEQLTEDLQKRVEYKSQQVVELEKQQAVSEERRRIMFDLHDGIGGQLVNAVNYLNRNPGSDTVLINTVNTALQDLRFIVDSIDTNGEQEPQLLLGTFRERFEPIVEAQGIQFVWNVHETFASKTLGPSEALNLLRILQEAVTNAIKHAQADTIYIGTTANTIEIEDNGVGIDLSKKSGLGIRSMRERAKNIGMQLDIANSARGTLVRLTLQP